MGQKSETIERSGTTSTTDTDSRTTTEEPPSWSELSGKANTTSLVKSSLALAGVALAFNLVLPIPGGVTVAVLLTTVLGSAVGFGGLKSGATSGAVAAGTATLLGAIFSFSIFGLTAVLPSLVIGGLVGAIGAYVGKNIRD